jgi:predicted Zn-dependent peptidase
MKATLVLIAALATLAPAHAMSETLDRTQRPAPGPNPSVATPKFSKHTLKNGLPVWIVSRRDLPMVNVTLGVRAGTAMDGQMPGLAAMTAALLDEGTASRSALEFSAAVGALGSNLGASAADEYTVVSLTTLSKNLAASLDLMGEMVARPAFKDEEVERERKSRLQSLKQQRDVAAVVANQVFGRLVYGDDHPYGHPASGTVAAVERIGRADVTGFYEKHYRPANAILVLVGDVVPGEAVAQLERSLGGWTGGPPPAEAKAVPARPAARPTGVFLVDKPNAAQSEIRIGHPGAARTTDPDYYALQVLNSILGGQFTSRINLNLREAKGFTYGARSTMSFRRGDGPFFVGGGIFTAKTDSALVEFIRELRDIRAGRAASAEEVAFARNTLTLSYPRRLETNDAVATMLGELAFYGIPESEITDYLTRVNRVTPDDVTRVANKYISPEHLTIVVVGDVAKIRPGIEALGLGPVTVVDADAKVVPQ